MASDLVGAVRRTGLVVHVPSAEALVGGFRRRFNAGSVALGLPPHVTVLYPFASRGELDEAMHEKVGAHFAGIARFDAELVAVARFERWACLVPAPADPLADLLAVTWQRFPEFPPYGASYDEPAPHLTVGVADDADLVRPIVDAAETELEPRLPLRFPVDAVSLLEELDDGSWSVTERYPLG